jgi:hypothetical protein
LCPRTGLRFGELMKLLSKDIMHVFATNCWRICVVMHGICTELTVQKYLFLCVRERERERQTDRQTECCLTQEIAAGLWDFVIHGFYGMFPLICVFIRSLSL